MAEDGVYSLKMRAEAEGRHISGAEKIIPEAAVGEFAEALLTRAMHHANGRPDFVVDSIKYIPFSGGQLVEMDAIVKTVSGVNVPLFEAKMPYKALLKGLDNQLRINLDADCRAANRYEGLQVGSVTAPNNNAGNWE